LVGKTTVRLRDDPHAARKRRREGEIRRAMLEYFEGLQKRVVEAVKENNA
jgi:hypothetical protein